MKTESLKEFIERGGGITKSERPTGVTATARGIFFAANPKTQEHKERIEKASRLRKALRNTIEKT